MLDIISNVIELIFSNALGYIPQLLAEGNKYVFGLDMSIDSLRSREFSVYIFIFLILSLILFCYIIYLYLPKKLSSLKTGEKVMFGALIFGVIAAVIMGYIQLIEGYLI